jgi:hypothetical protein
MALPASYKEVRDDTTPVVKLLSIHLVACSLLVPTHNPHPAKPELSAQTWQMVGQIGGPTNAVAI